MKNVLITGASTGIGREIALHLDRLGWRVFAGVRKEVDAERLQKDASPELSTLMLNVTDPDSIQAAIERVGEVVTDSGLDALINNAGISVNGPIEFVPMNELRQGFEVNFFGVVAMTQAALPLIRKADRGRIVHIGSIGGRQAPPILGPYAATKYAIEAIGEAQRRELQVWGIEVIVIEPGAIATPFWQKGQESAAVNIKSKGQRELELYGSTYDTLRAGATKAERRAVGPEAVAKVSRAGTHRGATASTLFGRHRRQGHGTSHALSARSGARRADPAHHEISARRLAGSKRFSVRVTMRNGCVIQPRTRRGEP